MWKNLQFNRGNIRVIVTMPINDIREHDEPGYLCPCRPKVVCKENSHDQIVHNSFDRRELKERRIC